MKKNPFNLTLFELVGLLIGLAGAAFFLTSPFDSLTTAGHIALSIFWLAAWLYVAEPIPVYATSLLVMLLASGLLAKEGPLYKQAKPNLIEISADSNGIYAVPQAAIFNQTHIYHYEKAAWKKLPIDIIERTEGQFFVKLNTTEPLQISADAYDLSSGYAPLSYKSIFGTLADPIIVLFLGGFMLARGAVKYRLDGALTAYLLRPFGTKPSSILFGLILVTAVLSAFMSNTATTAMMMTVILPILAAVPEKDKFKTAVVLSIPVAANIGGIATPIGTPPNAIVVAALAQQKIILPFSEWVILAGPYTIVMLVIGWILLQILYKPGITSVEVNLKANFNKEPKALALYAVFAITILLWFTESYHKIPSGMVAFIPVTLLTFGNILDKKDIHSLSWEVLWLVAGGMALGMIIDKTGVVVWLLQSIEWSAFSVLTVIIVFGLVAWLLSNFMSNTVTATLLMPLGITLGLSGSLGDAYSMVVASMVIGVGTSLAMILPISTPPNAIAVSTNLIGTKDMAVYGIIIGIIGSIALIGFAWFYWTLFY